jgi:hypothetical protein
VPNISGKKLIVTAVMPCAAVMKPNAITTMIQKWEPVLSAMKAGTGMRMAAPASTRNIRRRPNRSDSRPMTYAATAPNSAP